jgi:glycosyltransferase involved in cell wall biosynthesis
MRVMHVLDSFERGGAQQVVVGLSSWLQDNGHEVLLVGAEGALLEGIGDLQVESISYSSFVEQFVRIYGAARSFRPDILHAHQRREALICNIVGRLQGIAVVEHAHTLLPNRDLARLSFKSAVVFCVSPEIAAMVRNDYRAAGKVILTGNTPAFTSSDPPEWACLGLDEELRVVGVGRLTEQKDPLRFVRVIAAAAARHKISAKWLGDGPLLDAAVSLAAALDAPVQFSGFSNTVLTEIDNAHGLFLSSRWEGTPLVALEAMVRRRPVIAVNVGGLPSLLAFGRGTLVELDDPDEVIAQKLVQALRPSEHGRRSLGCAAEYVEHELSRDAVFGCVEDAYIGLGGRSA